MIKHVINLSIVHTREDITFGMLFLIYLFLINKLKHKFIKKNPECIEKHSKIQ